MASNSKNDRSGARRIALATLLLKNYPHGLALEEVVALLEIDGPKGTRVKAYDGDYEATRKKFQRDKADLEIIGLTVQTFKPVGGQEAEHYAIDPSSIFIGHIDFTADEQRLVAAALRLLGANQGLSDFFSDESVPGAGAFEDSQALQVLNRAIALGHVVTFRYQGRQERERQLVPLTMHYDAGRSYVVGFDTDNERVQGFRLSRILDTPRETPGLSVRNNYKDYFTEADQWLASNDHESEPLTVAFDFPPAAGEVFARLHGSVAAPTSKGVRVEVTYDSERDAVNAILASQNRPERVQNRKVRLALRDHLRHINQPSPFTERDVTWPPNERAGAGLMAQAIAIAGAMYDADEGLSAAQLAHRFDMEVDDVRQLMSTLICLTDPRDPTEYLVGFNVRYDVDEVGDEGPIYERVHTPNPTIADLGSYTWRDAYQIAVALLGSPITAKSSLAEAALTKLLEASKLHLTVRFDYPKFFEAFKSAIDSGEALRVEYLSEASNRRLDAGDDVDLYRVVRPVDIKARYGIYYAYVWVYEGGDQPQSYRSYRIDRVLDVHETIAGLPAPSTSFNPDWIDNLGRGGDLVTVVMQPQQRWLFETVPGAKWGTIATPDGALPVVQFAVTLPDWFDRQMVRAGAGASVLSAHLHDAGHDLAASLSKSLGSRF